ncbi:receptor-type tyrosine-protein phosphatase alpha [Biomphalaria pfeifferi]|uniref:protein-tyrosine-phosphatase n=1 Tax=Biomphalaria pfeifferi TaxID=112525 RepID=A0AAD8B2C7_BIOPF|nr:receptor-type tyrosine-protein phosphatase alpha [Biomphalaria pfeifferi]
MRLQFIFTSLIGPCTWILVSMQEDSFCSNGDFCMYQCHCARNCPGSSGTCPDKCQTGWFGARCQYRDLLAIQGATKSQTNSWLTDGDDSTCNNDPSFQELIVSWDKMYTLTWLRMVLKNTYMFSTVQLWYKTSSVYQKCGIQKWSQLNENTMDIRCEDNVMTNSLKVLGDISSLCSLYINGGRNVAYKQTATQTSNYSETVNNVKTVFTADLAVDGNSNSKFTLLSCTHTGTVDSDPRFTLTLNSPYIVNQFILYNRDGEVGKRLNGFRLISVDGNNNVVDNIKDVDEKAEPIYYLSVNTSKPVKTLSINETKVKSGDNVPFITLCEVEAYGECPPGKWSLPCTQNCSTSCPTSCDRDTGLCNTVCAGFSNPPTCSDECKAKEWGINCTNNCSAKCANQACHRITGECTQGCLGYSNPSQCTTECSKTNWGVNCSQNCSAHCVNHTCVATNGTCYGGCEVGYQPPDCTKECSKTTWGVHCSQSCSSHCVNNICMSLNGTCSDGCNAGYQLPDCTKTCDQGRYGRNCSFLCHSNCLNGTCSNVDGSCSCVLGYEGDFCDQEPQGSTGSVGVIVGPIVAGIVVVIIILAVVILWRRKRRLKSTRESNGHLNLAALSKGNNDLYKSSPDDVSIGDKEFTELNHHYSMIKDDTMDTLIAIESLNSFIKSKNNDFYKTQFQRIPAVTNVTQEIGLNKENKQKNRYKNICPYDHSRVHLEINTERNEMDYINASYIRGFNSEVKFIAAQGPQKSTINDFIRMLWEQKVDVVVMLTDLVEGTKVKCEKYWPDSDKMQIGYIKVKLGSTQVFADYTIRKLELSKKGESSHIFTQFHFTSWPDKGVPSTQWSLVDVEQRVTSIPTNKPIVVHCSAGVGRTGTFIALYNIMRQAEETGLVDFFKTVSKLREDRIFMVQTLSQYEFLHKAAQVAIACMRTTHIVQDLSDRLKVLEDKILLGKTKLEIEFQGLCAILEKRVDNVQDEANVYENTQKCQSKSEYELEQDDSVMGANSYLFLPGYKQRDQHVLVKIPKTSEDAAELWKFVSKYFVSLIVAFDADSNQEKLVQYLPNIVDQDVVFASTELKLTDIKQTKVWCERKLIVQTKNSANFLPSSRGHADTVTHLACLTFDLHPKTLLEIAKKSRQCYSKTGGKILYLCSDGILQSGLMAVLLHLLDRADNEACISVPLIVGTIKSLQPKIVPNFEQYQAVYRAVSRYIDTSTQYTNTYYQNNSSMKQNTSQGNDEKRKSQVQPISDITTAETTTDPKNNETFLYANVVLL